MIQKLPEIFIIEEGRFIYRFEDALVFPNLKDFVVDYFNHNLQKLFKSESVPLDNASKLIKVTTFYFFHNKILQINQMVT
jgi:hypothetical protein